MDLQEYSREQLQAAYPGFGTDYVLFPDEDGDTLVGYLKMDNRSKMVFLPGEKLEEQVKFEYFSR